jgi:PHP family Zn ribbon phosphoesterase
MTNLGSTHALALELYVPGPLLELVRDVGGLLASGQAVVPDNLHALYRKHQSVIVVG